MDTLNGVYTENLKTGGELKVYAHSWSICYYFPGPDMRYNGTFVYVGGFEIDSYISAWKNNFSKYLQLKELIPQGGNVEYPGENGMSIRLGFAEGVCLKGYHLPISTHQQLMEIIDDYEKAKKRATQIQQILLNG